jgi:hypothetical protein
VSTKATLGLEEGEAVMGCAVLGALDSCIAGDGENGDEVGT